MLNKPPNSWRSSILNDVAEYINGRGFKPREWGDEGLPIIRIEQINNPEAKCDYFNGYVAEENIIQDGDLLFSWSATLTTLIWDRGTAALNQHIFKVLPKNGNKIAFIHHLIDFNLDKLVGESHGTTMKHITRKDLNPFVVVLPDADEQGAIAKVMDSIDGRIRNTEKKIAKLHKLKDGLLHDLLTRGIGEDGKLRDPVAHPEQFKESRLGRIPKEWNIYSLKDSCGLIKDGTHLPPERTESGPLLLSVQNILNGKLCITSSDTRVPWEFFHSMHRSWEILPSDVLLAIVGATIGKSCQVPNSFEPFTIQRSLSILRGKSGILSNDYLYHFVTSKQFQDALWSRANQTAQPGVYLNEIGNLQIPLPLIEEQAMIQGILNAVNMQTEKMQNCLHKLQRIKSGLMHDLLTGTVRTTPLLTKAV